MLMVSLSGPQVTSPLPDPRYAVKPMIKPYKLDEMLNFGNECYQDNKYTEVVFYVMQLSPLFLMLQQNCFQKLSFTRKYS